MCSLVAGSVLVVIHDCCRRWYKEDDAMYVCTVCAEEKEVLLLA